MSKIIFLLFLVVIFLGLDTVLAQESVSTKIDKERFEFCETATM
jgi:hypothetical protein